MFSSFKFFKLPVFLSIALATLGLCLWMTSPVVANTYAQLEFYDASNSTLLGVYDGDSDRLTIPWASEISIRVSSVESETGKMRLSSGDCASGSRTDKSRPFEFTIEPSSATTQCLLTLEGWKSRGWDWQGREVVRVSFTTPASPPSASSTPSPSSFPSPSSSPEPEQRNTPVRPPLAQPVEVVPEIQPQPQPQSQSSASNTYAQLEFYDASNALLGVYNGDSDRLTIPWASEINIRVSSVESATGKMRLSSGDCSSGSGTDRSRPFEFAIEPSSVNTQCLLTLEGWKSRGWDWQGREVVRVSFTTPSTSSTQPTPEPEQQNTPSPSSPPDSNDPEPRITSRPDSSSSNPSGPVRLTPLPFRNGGASTLYRITQGTSGRTTMTGSSSSRPAHGVRIYCPPSHFAYDDPVIFPNQPGQSHLHVFIGNTEAKASSTPSSLLNGGNSSCEGGINVRSSYWTPAVISQGQAVIPATAWIYYKTFMANTNFEDLQIVPNGLKMLASSSTKGYKDQLEVEKNVFNTHTRKQSMKLTANFPNCIATRNGQWDGVPILDYRDMPGQASRIVNSHVAYAENSDDDLNHLGCPKTHPYRIPSMSIHQYYHLDDLKGGWKLASDIERGASTSAGETFHADYIAAWDDATMRFITDCNRFPQNCEFRGRRQLPERLLSPGGRRLYDYSQIVRPGTDMTPFGSMRATLR